MADSFPGIGKSEELFFQGLEDFTEIFPRLGKMNFE
jgi:hypothetical protein